MFLSTARISPYPGTYSSLGLVRCFTTHQRKLCLFFHVFLITLNVSFHEVIFLVSRDDSIASAVLLIRESHPFHSLISL
jgi:hypothetical protein